MASSSEATESLFETLLPLTLENARRTPFYRSRLEGIGDVEAGADNWHTLPLVTKNEIRSAGRSAQVRDGLVCNEVYTSGTSGHIFVTAKGDREQKYIREFHHQVFADFYERDLTRALQINNPYHGYLLPIPVPIHSHGIGIYDDGSFAHGRRVLLDQHDDRGVSPRCTVLVGLERGLRAFTMEARRAWPDGRETHLEAIISYSQYLTPRWRRIHRETFGCNVIDRFGLSEVFGGATQDLDCGWWHFDPVSYPEVIGARSRTPLREGIGELVLTALYPFQEAQPMIRYRTGDLVEVTHTRSSRPGVLAIRPLGRLRYGVPQATGDEYLLTPVDILEVMDEIDGIRRLPRFLDSPQVSDTHEIGHPMYRVKHQLERDITRIDVQVVLERPCEKFLDTIRESLVERSTRLATALNERRATLTIKGVDQLAPDLISHAE